MSNRLTKDERLLKRSDFDTVFQNGISASNRKLVVYGMPNGLTIHRLGLVVGKWFGKANKRNRWKRLCRESFRTSKDRRNEPGWDWIVLPNRRGKNRSRNETLEYENMQSLRTDLVDLCVKLIEKQK